MLNRVGRPCGASPRRARLRLALLLSAGLALVPVSVQAKCQKPMVRLDGEVRVASLLWPAAVPAGHVGITFAGHASFVIETPEGVRIITDYNGLNGRGRGPDIVTMNNAHTTHFTDSIEPGVKYVLRGWDPEGGAARHDLAYKDVQIWNIPTNVRDFAGGTRINGNSIFVFETADLCIAHVGHLHHRLSQEDLTALGRIDVLMVPVDGAYTLAQHLMLDVIKQVEPAIVLPMHWFSESRLQQFLARVRDTHEIVVGDSPTLVVSRSTLPARPRVVALPGW
ncbi:MAG: MBL fold metallo-hydrolase [Proteobacteria bacterium]|nr:MBL fold metallo-hydrolase [Pseudomonadota bacterium]